MKNLVADLKYDIIRFTGTEENNSIYNLGRDSLRAELKKAIKGEVNGNALYY